MDTFSEGETEFDKAESVLKEKCKILIVTKGERGAVLYKTEKGELLRIFVPAVKTEGKNRVGCGDIFGAAFFYSYICGESICDSLFFANAAAGEITNFTDFNDYSKLKKNVDEKYY